ncbi:precorrin-6A reductase [Tepidamorphus gemmatus]|uniref:Precorrin-6A reductase n=1 Tax=Tepidamorphus gemmatus TaxID=747076 RepID=A0A4R3MM75_9HYPH|nr:cobalt-precorrin-6A reductase [Tepidamorphus gemmatus]TCT13570.1 precorrin-6A reductase [Tepidamorphus gemmatus]
MTMHRLKVLILGGTSEASALARRLAGDVRFETVLSLAGVTKAPAAQPVPVRRGGFGGAGGLADHLRQAGFGALVDATHPFADRISANAAEAARIAGVPLLAVRRPAWQPQAGDRWCEVADMTAAAAALGIAPKRVLLTVGRQDLAAFLTAPQHRYVVRSVDPPAAELLPPDAEVITARGPFDEAGERALMTAHGIEVLVTKNSGGAATRAKLGAARALGIPVVIVARPPEPPVETVIGADEAYAWLERRHGESCGALRGV